MWLDEDEGTMHVYSGFARALLAVAPVGPQAQVKGSPAGIEAGLAVYRNNVRAAYLRILKETFPAVSRLVGDEFFRYAAHEYFHAYPPGSPLASRYGDKFPAFLNGFEPASAHPYLGDVARLEIAWLNSYHAAEAKTLAPEEISNRISDAPDRARFEFHPSAMLLSFLQPAFSIWRHEREQSEKVLRLPAGGERVLIVRPDDVVKVIPLDVATFITLQSLSVGARLGFALGGAIEECPTAAVGDIIQTTIHSGAFISARTD